MPSDGVPAATQTYMCWPVIDYVYEIYNLFTCESPAATPASRLKPKFGAVMRCMRVDLVAESVGILWWEKVGALQGVLIQAEEISLNMLMNKTDIGLPTMRWSYDGMRNIYKEVL